LRIRRATHKDDAGSGERRGSDEPDVVQLDEAAPFTSAGVHIASDLARAKAEATSQAEAAAPRDAPEPEPA
jgi:hypothetical protein